MTKGLVVCVSICLGLGLPLAWLAGEKHKENCIRANLVSCSVLPWDTGESRCAPTCAKIKR